MDAPLRHDGGHDDRPRRFPHGQLGGAELQPAEGGELVLRQRPRCERHRRDQRLLKHQRPRARPRRDQRHAADRRDRPDPAAATRRSAPTTRTTRRTPTWTLSLLGGTLDSEAGTIIANEGSGTTLSFVNDAQPSNKSPNSGQLTWR
ncbi:MAG: hypothetical protein WDO13_15690 [Verrucomicrobiota bacterium]